MNLKTAQHLVDGNWYATETTKDVTDPGNGTVTGQVCWGSADDAALVTEEVFGPAAGVVTFSDEEDALRKANSTEMGLAAYVWTGSAKRSWSFSERLEAGIVGINDPLPSVAFAPMEGAKQSGLGREGSDLGMEEFQEVKYMAWRP